MRPETAALVIHDLKNALGALEAELDMLAREAEDGGPDPANHPDDAGDQLHPPASAERARRSHQQCSALRQRFVQFLMVYAAGDRLLAHCNDESPAELLETVAQAHQEVRGNLDLRVEIDPETPPFWYLDRRLVRMALDAALHNALRFAHSRITLCARSSDGYLVLAVADDGPGLGGVDPSVHSTGLGTALCESVAQAHSSPARTGRVVLENRPEGGARFEIWLA